MTASRTTWTVSADGVELQPISGTINISELTVPAITASFLIPYDETIDALDPRSKTPPRVTIKGTRKFWVSHPLSEVSAYATAQGGTLADLTAAWAGLQLRDVSGQFGGPLWSLAPDQSETMEIELHLREIRTDFRQETIALDLASHEQLLLDWSPSSIWDLADLSQWAQSFNLERASAWVNLMLGAVFGSRLTPGPYDSQPLSSGFDSSILDSIEASAYDMIRPALEDSNLKLRVSPDGRSFSLQRPVNPLNNPAVHSFTFNPENVNEMTYGLSRDGDWYDAAMLTEENVGGGFGYPRGEHSRTYREKFSQGFGLTESAAQNIVERARNRGRTIDITAPTRMGVFMRDYFYWQPVAELPGEEWQVQSVTYDLLADTISIRGVLPY